MNDAVDPTRQISAVVYTGVRYPITHDVAESILAVMDGLHLPTSTKLFEVPTTDGRQVILNLSHSFPIAFEIDHQQNSGDQ
ncbi:hypothetical protein [Gordonia sp. (in: high G+C Gram-positive bacteria)]|jgi:hypothetical protein|uniref:hypothetical protein n=1 Tax=Gordonia sp. (in: high G+C Gram-positive bacteria) TaxID=84139 RepID=UPI001D658DE3|nr:hypothetical protein [Gordonia sp. (in: high G+C Gram-positive bacteria)]MCB1297083.1 hypothetical protein [Gordonia sp. (in: high G+C Gram-positive bacteria)]HMS74151.1 hypothetical protein [Gordonia sp. (in: high G+C Gram-positive bacteria)]HQV17380.1 hypothetical protein [Gordonia sp. (in: high G+C Gram-positive bacteria)]